MTTPLPTNYQPGQGLTAAAHNAENARINALSDALAAAGQVVGSNNGVATNLTLWKGTLAQYAALLTYDDNTVYVAR